ncbi:MAG: serine hydroxymethyltransferase [Candidatus Gastranaerophilaceae bacterium]|mgnify:FL=1|jgi:glycine hydroxymethyltransferase|nr:serine hydroxymethyltransferase [Fusobacterium sp. CAG:815]DAA93662.1 MAG TPA: serine hydroxymethyltransferase [Candidatus Gastranaerophilales bacterium HUM_7]DAA93885.1 MAG TPA: serine hydroxymethyltransferase [Candidatus Gastranaerophilales bacterium HUM_6]DAB02280.1 MAG TPA: serine hydroxymethyltransferase [Candidatus Gastranaerophilales bacterium HUM_12]DAB07207.1 MAG TPA: serine hydroxymethyltransferase [Candidatus Gastranaerophilales bacterium HUM_14]
MNLENIKKVDPQVAEQIELELQRQQETIELIASENCTSEAVMEACGSVLTNKYAEGKPHKRYYNGCEHIDVIEEIAQKRACELFHMDHANVQPHSGAQANMAVFMATMKPGDRVLSMDLSNGGHLSHGSPVNFSGMYFDVKSYGINENGEIDYEDVRKMAIEHKPKLIICGASNYSKIIDFKKFREIADEVGALLLADIAHIAGLVVAGVHPSPAPYCDFVTTTTHKSLRGPRGGIIMCKEKFAKDIDKAVFPGMQGGPLEHIIAGKAVALLEASKPEFVDYAKQIVKNAKALAQGLMDNGLDIVGGMTENHLMTLDLRKTGKTGKDMANVLERVGITANKNTVPNDPQSPFVTSGIRLGTPAVTTRGFKEEDMTEVAKIIASAVFSSDNEEELKKLREKSLKLCKKYPLYNK